MITETQAKHSLELVASLLVKNGGGKMRIADIKKQNIELKKQNAELKKELDMANDQLKAFESLIAQKDERIRNLKITNRKVFFT